MEMHDSSVIIDPVELYQAAKPGPGDTKSENRFSQAQGKFIF